MSHKDRLIESISPHRLMKGESFVGPVSCQSSAKCCLNKLENCSVSRLVHGSSVMTSLTISGLSLKPGIRLPCKSQVKVEVSLFCSYISDL